MVRLRDFLRRTSAVGQPSRLPFVLGPSRLKNHQPGGPVDWRQPGRLPHYDKNARTPAVVHFEFC